MKKALIASLLLALSLFGCNQVKKQSSIKKADSLNKDSAILQTNKSNASSIMPDSVADKKEIQLLVRNVLLWAESGKAPNLTPVITDSKDRVCIGFDDEGIKTNCDVFRSTNYFSSEFIDNYALIFQTLEKELKDKKFDPWSANDLPPFNFANDVDPWSNSQDVPYDKPNAYGLVDVHIISLNNQEGELYWTWGGLPHGTDPSWKDIKYKFKVRKENNKWKISYMQGFDFAESVKYVKD